MELSSWGNYPRVEAERVAFRGTDTLRTALDERAELIARGNGRSYGDSALSDTVVDVRPQDLFLRFDAKSGLLRVQAGALLAEILDTFVPRGWFLKVTPGTKLITVGGAIASDVHGKNHHVGGCFSECVTGLRLMLANGEVMSCSKDVNTEMFRATCGGMGLTGVILDADIELQKIGSAKIGQTTVKTSSLEETFATFERYEKERFSVAWIDSLATGKGLGRGVFMAGDFLDDGDFTYDAPRKLTVPFHLPSFAINRLGIGLFNKLYYAKTQSGESRQTVDIDTFFYPLDAIGHWNRIYGRNGFQQYQFVLPKASSLDGLREVLSTVARSGPGSFLSVLKLCGPANENYLSFPLEGYSLAMDFKMSRRLPAHLDELDTIVARHGGRLYLTKDARVSRAMFETGYPHIETFRALRRQHGMDNKFQSLQSRRLGL